MSKDLMDPFNFDDDFDNPMFDNKDNNFFSNLGHNMFNSLKSFGNDDGRANVSDNKNNYAVSIELPGFKKNDIDLDYRNNTLRVSAHHNLSKDNSNKKKNVIHKEFSSSNVKRAFHLPSVEFNKISASYDGGILKINLPKKPEVKDNSHKIDIK